MCMYPLARPGPHSKKNTKEMEFDMVVEYNPAQVTLFSVRDVLVLVERRHRQR